MRLESTTVYFYITAIKSRSVFIYVEFCPSIEKQIGNLRARIEFGNRIRGSRGAEIFPGRGKNSLKINRPDRVTPFFHLRIENLGARQMPRLALPTLRVQRLRKSCY